jgi:hypothetical protein
MNLHLFPTRKIILGLCALLLPATLALMPAVSLAVERTTQPSADTYDLSWWTVDGGGATLSNGAYSLSGTAGQPDAGVQIASLYALSSGFWGGGGSTLYYIYLALIRR